MELMLQKIIEGLDESYGQQFFEKIVINLSSVLEVDYVFIARVNLENHISSTIALAAEGKIVDNIEYDLKDTPCEDVSNHSSVCITNNITSVYPKDKLLQDMDIESYIGVPLINSKGKAIGILVALSKKEVSEDNLITTIFQIFSGRVTAEMERETLQEENRKQTERFELAISGSNDGLWDWNIEDNSLYLSPRWKDMLGFKDNELPNTFDSWKEHIHPDDMQKTMEDVQSYLEKKTTTYKNSHRLKHKNGSWIWINARGKAQFDDSGKAFRMIGTHTDITKEKKLEEELKKVNSSLEEIVKEKVQEIKKQVKEQTILLSLFDRGDPVLFNWNNDEDWSIKSVSLNVKNLLGYEKEEFESGKIVYASCIYKDDLDTVIKEVMEASQSGAEFFKHAPYRIYDKNNEIKWVLDYTTIVRDENGDITNYIGIISDITELKNKDKKLLQQSRLAQLGEMISMIAHQWRQPLGAISATSIDLQMKLELEAFDLEEEKEKNEFLDYFNNSLKSVNDLVDNLSITVDDFRNFYKPNKKSATLKLQDVISKSLNIIKASLLSDNIEIIQEYNSKEEIELYDNEIMQVFLNLFKNSQDNFRERKVKDPYIKIIIKNRVVIVCDNGGGIAEDVMNKIYDPYFSTKDEMNGSGLGLYMSKIIVEEHHNGKLSAENTDDGICFKIEL